MKLKEPEQRNKTKPAPGQSHYRFGEIAVILNRSKETMKRWKGDRALPEPDVRIPQLALWRRDVTYKFISEIVAQGHEMNPLLRSFLNEFE